MRNGSLKLLLVCGLSLLPAGAPALAQPAADKDAQEASVPASDTKLSLAKAPDIAARYGLPDWMDEKWLVIVHRGDLTIDRHLLLDWTRDSALKDQQAVLWLELFAPGLKDEPRAAKAQGLVVDGNLTVNGSILNTNEDGGPTLVVTGKTTARSLLAGGAFINFRGPAQFSEAIHSQYNHGELYFEGPVKAPLLINSDHALSLMHSSGKSGIRTYFSNEEHEDWNGVDVPATVKPVVRPEFTTIDAIRDAIRQAKPVLKQQ